MNRRRKKKNSSIVFLRAFLERCEARDCMAADLGLSLLALPSNLTPTISDILAESNDAANESTPITISTMFSSESVGSAIEIESLDQAIDDWTFDENPVVDSEEGWSWDQTELDFTPGFGDDVEREWAESCDSDFLAAGVSETDGVASGLCEVTNTAEPYLPTEVGGAAVSETDNEASSPSETTQPPIVDLSLSESGDETKNNNIPPMGTVTLPPSAPSQNVSPSQSFEEAVTELPSIGPIAPLSPLQSNVPRDQDLSIATEPKPLDSGLKPILAVDPPPQEHAQAFVSFSSAQLLPLSVSSISQVDRTIKSDSKADASRISDHRVNYFASVPTAQRNRDKDLPKHSEQEIAQVFELVQIAGLQTAVPQSSGLFSVDGNAIKRLEPSELLLLSRNHVNVDLANSATDITPSEAEVEIKSDVKSNVPNRGWRWGISDLGLVFIGILTFWDEKRGSRKLGEEMIAKEFATKSVTNKNAPDPLK
jgi:hypothetical protein